SSHLHASLPLFTTSPRPSPQTKLLLAGRRGTQLCRLSLLANAALPGTAPHSHHPPPPGRSGRRRQRPAAAPRAALPHRVDPAPVAARFGSALAGLQLRPLHASPARHGRHPGAAAAQHRPRRGVVPWRPRPARPRRRRHPQGRHSRRVRRRRGFSRPFRLRRRVPPHRPRSAPPGPATRPRAPRRPCPRLRVVGAQRRCGRPLHGLPLPQGPARARAAGHLPRRRHRPEPGAPPAPAAAAGVRRGGGLVRGGGAVLHAGPALRGVRLRRRRGPRDMDRGKRVQLQRTHHHALAPQPPQSHQ
uniref:Uncharacterized protein n=1 Tax=Aegilops tauschii subsp. strangulata TaxID=200361 RepID=A0A452ZI46_AEGTS